MKNVTPPTAKKIAHELEKHGDIRVDNYYWLNDRENPEVIDYLTKENSYTEAVMADTKEFQEKLYNEIVGRIKQTDESVPYKHNGYYYYIRYEEGKEYPIYCRKKETLENPEEIMLNVNELAEGHEYFSVSGVDVSSDNKLLAYGVDTVSRRIYSIHVKNLETGEMYSDIIPVSNGYVAWVNDNKNFYYSVQDLQTLRSNKIMKHTLGESSENDKTIFVENDETFNVWVSKSKSEKYIIIGSGATLSTEFQFADANDANAKFKIVEPRSRDHEYSVSHFGDYFYIITNWNAKNFRLMKTPVSKPGKENWTEVIPHRSDVLLQEIEIFNNYLVVSERKNGLNQLRVMNWDFSNEYYIDFGEEVYVARTSTNLDFNSKILRYSYSSLTTPSSQFDFDLDTKDKVLLKQQEVVGDFNSENYEAKRLYATARDGKKVPISLVYRKGIELNGKNPLLLYAYGSYGYTVDPYFSSVRLSLLDRGFVFAIAHIRGGQIYGREWYEDGKLLHKMNTFTDYIDCAKYLISENYTNPDKLFAQGGSAGGLLMGAVVNLNPELFKGVIAAVPFVDVVTTMLDESIPLTTGEYDEWGNPNDSVYYKYMLSYSPYDNVKSMNYPNILVTTGLHDSQVQYWEPAKWVAKLRELKTDNNILILNTNMDAGHGGASGRFKQHKETAMEYAFFFKLAGINK